MGLVTVIRWSKLRPLARRARWRWLDAVDRLLFTEAVDRASVRRLMGTPMRREEVAVHTIYVDVSVIHKNDSGTGIQRVVRSLHRHLPGAIRSDIGYKPVIVGKRHGDYTSTSGAPLVGSPGTVFFGLDFATDSIFAARHELRRFKGAGGQIWFLVHDLLPLTNPRWFTPASRIKYRRWLRVCAALADGILCVSPPVAEQLTELLARRYGLGDLPRIATIDLGSDITEADRGLRPSELPTADGLDSAKFKRAVLVVGTLEPRKGHSDALSAFDHIWADGHDIPLVFIGRPGWNTSDLQARIRRHQQAGRNLFWLDQVDDHQLHAAYHNSRLVLVPPLAEGYGLPLDEALALGAPVLCRDIPVFRRHDSAAISYFDETASAETIASSVLKAYGSMAHARTLEPLREWRDTASQVAEILGCRGKSTRSR
jgi:glycosyltransferase involved in cell wall biosynthesis